MLSGDGDHPMIKLSDTQAVILSAASQRDDGAVLPLPETLKLTGGALAKVLGSLKARGLIEHQGTPRGDDSPPLRITRAGLQAIGVAEDEPDSTPVPVTDAPQGAPDAQEARTAGQEPQAPAAAAKRKAKKAGKPAKPAQGATGKPPPRAGTKQAKLIELLQRPEGATVEQIAAATGWQHHTIRGAIAGALKKKLGLKVEATRTREVGPNKAGAKGSATVYRIVG
jgi:DNA-binding MarR family transcriptional regulator